MAIEQIKGKSSREWVTIKEFAEEAGISYEAARKKFLVHKREFPGHYKEVPNPKMNGRKCMVLDRFLCESLINNTTCDQLRREIARLTQENEQLKKEKIDQLVHASKIMDEASKQKEEAVSMLKKAQAAMDEANKKEAEITETLNAHVERMKLKQKQEVEDDREMGIKILALLISNAVNIRDRESFSELAEAIVEIAEAFPLTK